MDVSTPMLYVEIREVKDKVLALHNVQPKRKIDR